MRDTDYCYDIESYPNIFTLTAIHINTATEWVFEISDRRNDYNELLNFLMSLRYYNSRMIGFNNIGYDYPIIHSIMEGKSVTCDSIYSKSMSIINSPRGTTGHIIWGDNRFIEQIDLYKIHHFDNKARSTSLKMLEFNMRSSNIKDLPFTPGTWLDDGQKDELITYNKHDVKETINFALKSEKEISFREELTNKYQRDFMNHNDTKIGKDYFIMMLGIDTRNMRQTHRDKIYLRQAILPSVKFERSEFNDVKNWLENQVITETKGVFKGLHAIVEGFKYDFGLGGIHGSVSSQVVHSDDQYVIIDLDVASYYPNLAISNRLYPAHLGSDFCDIYLDVYNQRKNHAKGTPENAMLKLALNGVYGDSNSEYSPFYDPLYTMTITINGQLLLCMLAEQLVKIQGLSMVQINTDGLTVRVPRNMTSQVDSVRCWWQNYTGLELEEAIYSRMFIRDVNNYVAEYENGDVKRKGAYEYELDWSKNHGQKVVAKAAEACLIHGVDIKSFITSHTDLMDFMLRTKVPRSSKLVVNDGVNDTQVQNITRYYVAKKEEHERANSLFKIMPPTPSQIQKSKFGAHLFKNTRGGDFIADTLVKWENAMSRGYTFVHSDFPPARDQRTGVTVGWNIRICNDIADATHPIDYDYYINETNKLVSPLLNET